MHHTKDEMIAAIHQLQEGAPIAELSASLGIEASTMHTWNSLYEGKALVDRREVLRTAFQSTVTAANLIRSSMGSSQALDYAKFTGGQNAQNLRVDSAHAVIDYSVDVVRAANETLDAGELAFFNKRILDQDFESEMLNQSVAFLRLQEKLGIALIERGLHPASTYFHSTKE